MRLSLQPIVYGLIGLQSLQMHEAKPHEDRRLLQRYTLLRTSWVMELELIIVPLDLVAEVVSVETGQKVMEIVVVRHLQDLAPKLAVE